MFFITERSLVNEIKEIETLYKITVQKYVDNYDINLLNNFVKHNRDEIYDFINSKTYPNKETILIFLEKFVNILKPKSVSISDLFYEYDFPLLKKTRYKYDIELIFTGYQGSTAGGFSYYGDDFYQDEDKDSIKDLYIQIMLNNRYNDVFSFIIQTFAKNYEKNFHNLKDIKNSFTFSSDDAKKFLSTYLLMSMSTFVHEMTHAFEYHKTSGKSFPKENFQGNTLTLAKKLYQYLNLSTEIWARIAAYFHTIDEMLQEYDLKAFTENAKYDEYLRYQSLSPKNKKYVIKILSTIFHIRKREINMEKYEKMPIAKLLKKNNVIQTYKQVMTKLDQKYISQDDRKYIYKDIYNKSKNI